MERHEKVVALGNRLKREFIERDTEIDLVLLALVSGKPLFLLGGTGVAKTELAQRTADYIGGATFFSEAIDPFTTKEDLFGPRNLQALQEGRWERVIEDSLLSADVVMIDEMFEGEAILKTLMRALNEGTFRQAGTTYRLPKRLTIAASNAIPAPGRLDAIYDRLLLRRVVSPIADKANRERLLTLEFEPVTRPWLMLDDVRQAQDQSPLVSLPSDVTSAVIEIHERLGKKALVPSDRRLRSSMPLVKAAAWLQGRTEARVGDLWVLRHTMWNRPEEQDTVAEVIVDVAEPVASEVQRIASVIAELQAQVKAQPTEAKRKRLAIELTDKIAVVYRDIRALPDDDGAGLFAACDQLRQSIGTVLWNIPVDA